MRLCSKCKKEKSLDEFYSRGQKRPGLYAYCKLCHLRYTTGRLQRQKARVITFMGGVCVDCKQAFHPAIFQLHHLDAAKKDVSWQRLKYRSWDKILKEIAKCVLLCANCHCLRHVDIENYAEAE